MQEVYISIFMYKLNPSSTKPGKKLNLSAFKVLKKSYDLDPARNKCKSRERKEKQKWIGVKFSLKDTERSEGY